MTKIIREPLIVFLMFGGLIFALFELVSTESQRDSVSPGEIIITQGRVEAQVQGFARVWQRQPTQAELNYLIENYIREEILYREALALGLDRNDPIVRRRMRQKLEFLSEDLTRLEQPEEEELQAYLDNNRESYQQSPQFSFRQVYLGADQSDAAHLEAARLLAQLRERDVDAEKLGDPSLFGHQFDREAVARIERSFGRQFAAALQQVKTGGWQGPIASGFGLHLVSVSEHIEAEPPQLSEVRAAVVRDWSAEKRQQMNNMIYQSLRRQYKVTVEGFESEGQEGTYYRRAVWK